MTDNVANAEMQTEGLGDDYQRDWGRVEVTEPERAIERLKPNSDLHKKVLDYLLKRLDASERQMQKFHTRWRRNEMKLQAYISLPDYEEMQKQKNDAGEPPKQVSIIIPTTQAVVSTITTYLTQAFTGRYPAIQVGFYDFSKEPNAHSMERVLQYNLDHSVFAKQFAQVFQDWQIYGFSVLRNAWMEEWRWRTMRENQLRYDISGNPVEAVEVVRKKRMVYQGNIVVSQDPYMFFPDPSVPLTEVAEKGEYVFWRTFESKAQLLKDQADGVLLWVNDAPETIEPSTIDTGSSTRSSYYYGEPHPGRGVITGGKGRYQVDQCSIEIIPEELQLGPEGAPERWLFTILNKGQIVQADRQDDDHGQHPIAVSEPLWQGYGFGQPGTVDYIHQLQDAISWLINSRQQNVMAAMHNTFVIDPKMIVMKDLKLEKGELPRYIRLKESMMGADVRTAIQQLPVSDVTQSHVNDMNVLFSIIERVTGVGENLMGAQDAGGRKTATEIRTAAVAAGGRLSFLTKLISAQQITKLGHMMSLNLQQYLDDDFFIEVTGPLGLKYPIKITPDRLVGDFHFPIHDGTLPLDRAAMLGAWQQALDLLIKIPGLAQRYDATRIFERATELSGVEGISQMRVSGTQALPNQTVENQAQAGNLVPIQ